MEWRMCYLTLYVSFVPYQALKGRCWPVGRDGCRQGVIVVQVWVLAERRAWLQTCADAFGGGTGSVEPCLKGSFDPAAGPGDAISGQVDPSVCCRVQNAEELVV